MKKISIISDNKEFAVREIPEGNAVLFLGRHSECDIILPGTGISRKHARILSGNGQIFIEDLNSTAGTMLNGTKIEEMQPFSANDIVQIANYKITLVSNDNKNSAFMSPVNKSEPVSESIKKSLPPNDFKKEFANATLLFEPEIMALTKSIHEDILEKLN